ncbi:MAG: hypothetical protein BroJett040_11170 [Oligoflexia bacterium]|nr:MAG: hypothetical protein BroJett040_11170 [Oligoflexia bacterium]
MKLFASIVSAVLFVSGLAFAQGPCHDDIQKFCKDVQPGEGRMAKCMKDNKDKFSKACQDHMAQMKEAVKEGKEACYEDIKKLCADVKPGGGRIIKCLNENKDKLSDTCKAQHEQMKEKRKERKGKK